MRGAMTALILGLMSTLQGQTADRILSEEEFLILVAEHHPLAVRADLQRERAAAVLQSARGGFDPKVYGDVDQKYFKGTRYYSVLEGGLKVPTWFGVELNAAYERNGGTYLNPERSVPENGLYAAGLSVSLGRGLFFDERRAELKRAEVYRQSTEAERAVQINELLYSAAVAYWTWAGTQGAVTIFEEAVSLATTRYEATISGALLGDRPAIDTLEARIQLQNRQLSLETARLDLANSLASLSAFLWVDGVVPVELDSSTLPLPQSMVEVAPLISVPTAGENPQLLRTRLKLNDLEIDERLQIEQLKPLLDFKYNALLSGGLDDPIESVSSRNYKWGIKFSQPILLRKERGKLALTRIKQSELQLELSDKIALLGAKVRQAVNEVDATARQYTLALNNAGDYERLLAGERELFLAGESSLFLVNSREVKYIEARIKQLELLAKHRKARQALAYAQGTLVNPAGADLPTE